MAFKRYADAQWNGDLQAGKGSISTPQSGLFEAQNFSFKTRFGDEKGTNPEELIAAAHSGCYTMQLSFLLSEAGYVPENLDTEARLTFEDGTITKIHLELNASVPGLAEDKFQELATKAKAICPVSKVLIAEITLTATLS